jgi:hypothetical protein
VPFLMRRDTGEWTPTVPIGGVGQLVEKHLSIIDAAS